jgi:transposase-like protein
VTWHLDEVYLKIDGRMVYLWRAVDSEGEVLDVLVQSKRNKHAALKLMRKLLKKYAFARSDWSRTTCGLMALRLAILGLSTCMSMGDGRTIGPRIHISPPDGGNARCNVSRAPGRRRNSCRRMPPCTTLSTSNAISSQLHHIASFAPRP